MTAARPLVSTVGNPGNDGAQESHHDPRPGWEPPPRTLTAAGRSGPTPSIADFYADLLQPLNERQRKGLIARLSVGYFEGWHPSRQEMAQLVAQELRRGHPRR